MAPSKISWISKSNGKRKPGKRPRTTFKLGDGEDVSSGNITAPEPPAGEESAVSAGEQAQNAAPVDDERAQAAAEADQHPPDASAEADQEWAEASAPPDDESHQQAAAEDEEQFGRPAEESEPVDETWVEDDTDVNDPDID